MTVFRAMYDIKTISSVVFMLSILTFHSSYKGDFVFDDLEAVINNRDVYSGAVSGDSTPVHNLFFHDFWGTNLTSKTSHKSYRPLTTLTFRSVFCIVFKSVMSFFDVGALVLLSHLNLEPCHHSFAVLFISSKYP